MGEALGYEPKNAQGTWRRWEEKPDRPAARRGFERAKEFYRKKTGKEWVTQELPDQDSISRADFDALLNRMKILEAGFQASALIASAVKDLDERVQKIERRVRSRE
jgi:hypothetical protein